MTQVCGTPAAATAALWSQQGRTEARNKAEWPLQWQQHSTAAIKASTGQSKQVIEAHCLTCIHGACCHAAEKAIDRKVAAAAVHT